MTVARILAIHFCKLSYGYEALLAGNTADQPAAQKWVKEHYGRPQSEIFGEKVGKSSHIRAWIRGELSADNYEVSITNWSLKARWYRIAPAGPETGPDRAIRLANAEMYEAAVETLQGQIRTAYVEAHKSALTTASLT
ncbi:hypothetical protein P153DRAFT_287939 [Dothidotthia symphoricarpi CBS 119687]|uniref:Uncharacterized protein n=1 Tax=Dothidotthia symphoricarpi CBS 119687 TaxID=1392245 RepID=A0A6A6AJL7_9PLEO|nr:uncharacterized protein P153DRAFT_287939 [Dothidotthia symphoricarpi CBS 119687]KAF2131104.1 hypothetical protein P153DRAFT_287939 [Dothidotthia symphoricarpi CBS 119687]